MSALTADRIDSIITRLESIPDDREPEWGTLRKESLVRHLIWAMQGSMDLETQSKDQGNVVLKTLVKPLVLNGLLKLPKNVRFKDDSGAEVNTLVDEGGIEELRAEMNTFVQGVQAGTLETAPHPVFGDIGPKGWAKLHHQHFEHHFRQFGV